MQTASLIHHRSVPAEGSIQCVQAAITYFEGMLIVLCCFCLLEASLAGCCPTQQGCTLDLLCVCRVLLQRR
jgi:hypothetical protein